MIHFILALVISVFVIGTSWAQEEVFSLTCREIYAKTLEKKVKKKEGAQKLAASVYGSSLAVVFTGNAFAVAGTLFGGLAIHGYSLLDSKEQRIDKLQQEGSKILGRLQKKLQKKIDSSITQDEIAQVIKDGIDSGVYCQDFPDLYNVRKIKKHVRKILSEKYSAVAE